MLVELYVHLDESSVCDFERIKIHR
jgi:hypothetical protein